MGPDDLQTLRQILVAERDSLRAGAFADISALAARKTTIVARLSAQPHDLSALRQTLTHAQENQRLILAALKGIGSARARLRAIRNAENGLTSYTAEGRTLRLGQDASQVERHA